MATKRNKRRTLEIAGSKNSHLHLILNCWGMLPYRRTMPWWLQKAVRMRQWNLVQLPWNASKYKLNASKESTQSPHTHTHCHTHTHQDQLWIVVIHQSNPSKKLWSGSLSLSLSHPGVLHKRSIYSAKAKLSRVRKSAWSKRNPRVQWFNPDHGLSFKEVHTHTLCIITLAAC